MAKVPESGARANGSEEPRARAETVATESTDREDAPQRSFLLSLYPTERTITQCEDELFIEYINI